MSADRAPETLALRDNGGGIPNSPLPALVYHAVSQVQDPADCERLFAANGWRGAWRDGIFSYHHFHSWGPIQTAWIGTSAAATRRSAGRRFPRAIVKCCGSGNEE